MERYGWSNEGNDELPNDVRTDLDEIGKEMFMADTLETRNSDALDFHDTSVWAMREAMKRAYLLGKQK